MSLSLPYVPARLVIEVTDPALSIGQRGGESDETAQAIPALVVHTPAPAAIAPALVSYGRRA
jgi:hypothetical protein